MEITRTVGKDDLCNEEISQVRLPTEKHPWNINSLIVCLDMRIFVHSSWCLSWPHFLIEDREIKLHKRYVCFSDNILTFTYYRGEGRGRTGEKIGGGEED